MESQEENLEVASKVRAFFFGCFFLFVVFLCFFCLFSWFLFFGGVFFVVLKYICCLHYSGEVPGFFADLEQGLRFGEAHSKVPGRLSDVGGLEPSNLEVSDVCKVVCFFLHVFCSHLFQVFF